MVNVDIINHEQFIKIIKSAIFRGETLILTLLNILNNGRLWHESA